MATASSTTGSVKAPKASIFLIALLIIIAVPMYIDLFIKYW